LQNLQYEKSCNPSDTASKIYEWFLQYKADELKKRVLPESRQKAGFDVSHFLLRIGRPNYQAVEENNDASLINLKLIVQDQDHSTGSIS